MFQRWYPRKSKYDLIYETLYKKDKAEKRLEEINTKAKRDHMRKGLPLLRYYLKVEESNENL